MVKKFKTLFSSEQLVYIISTLCCTSLHIFDWYGGVDLPVYEHVEYAIVLILTLMVPTHPTIISSILFLTCVIMSYNPFQPINISWITCYPSLFAVIVLASQWGDILSSILFIGDVQVISLLDSSGIPIFRGIPYIIMPISTAWCIGTLLRYSLVLERQKTTIHEKELHRAEQSKLLHLLHDSVANNLVYAIIELRKIRPSSVSSVESIHLQNVIDTLENTLDQLREQAITPMKQRISTGGKNNTSYVTVVSHPHDVKEAIYIIAQQLKKCDFTGYPQCEGDPSRLNSAQTTLLTHCIREIGGNIVKYGKPGEYALSIQCSEDCVTIISSNCIRTEAFPQRQSHNGLSLLRDDIRSCGGSISYTAEDNEWSIYLRIPIT